MRMMRLAAALCLCAAAWGAPGPASAKSSVASGRGRKHARVARWALAGTRLDLPYFGFPLARSYSRRLAVPLAVRGGASYGGEGGGFAYDIGSWSSGYLAKKDLEGRLQSGTTLPAPIWRQKNFSMMLLLPFDRQRMDVRALPVGGMMRLGLFRSAASKETPK